MRSQFNKRSLQSKIVCIALILEIAIIIGLMSWVRQYQERVLVTTDAVEDLSNFALSRGTYEIHVDYVSDNKMNGVAVITASNDPLFLTDQLQCYPWSSEGTIGIWAFRQYEDLSLVYSTADTGQVLELSQVSITATNTFRKMIMTTVILLFILMDLIGLWICKVLLPSDNRKATFIYAVIIMAAVMACSSYIFDIKLIPGADFEFHFDRIFGVVEALQYGEYPTKILPYFFWDSGYAVSIFYGDYLLLIPALLYLGGIPFTMVFHIFAVFIMALTACVAWVSFRSIATAKPALLATVIYTCALYRQWLFISQMRLGETIALIFIPLAFAGFYMIMHGLEQPEWLRKGWKMLAIGMTLIVTNHALSTVLAVFILAIWSLLYIKVLAHREILWNMGKATLVALGLSLWYLVPFVESLQSGIYMISNVERTAVELNMPLDIPALFYVSGASDAKIYYGVLWTILHVGCLAYGIARLIRKRDQDTYHYWILLLITGITFTMATDIFPWASVDKLPIFKTLVEMIQFKSRFACFLLVLLSIGICEIFRIEELGGNKCQVLSGGVVMGLCTALIINAGVVTAELTNYNVLPSVKLYSITGMDLFAGYLSYASNSLDFFYFPKDYYVDQFLEMNGQPQDNEAVLIETYEKSGVQIEMTCTNTSEAEEIVVLPLTAYPYYVAKDADSGEKLTLEATDQQALALVLPSSYYGTIKIEYEEPWYWTAASVASILMAIIMIGMYIKAGRVYARTRSI